MNTQDAESEIIVEVTGDDVIIHRRDGAEGHAHLEFDDLRRETVKVFQDQLRQGRICRRRELEVLGKHLFASLFAGEALSFFEQSMSEVLKSRKRLRIQLRFDQYAKELASLPWEFLYYASRTGIGFFLSTHADLVLSRYIAPDDRKPLTPEGSPLRILVVVSQPADLGPVVSEPVIDAIQKLAGNPENPLITIERCDRPTIDNLLQALEQTRPHVLHFLGHGRFNTQENQGEIALMNYDETRIAWHSDRIFAEYFFNLHAVPRLVLLHMCEGGTVDFEADFAGLASQLIMAGVDAVVAMQYPIPNSAAVSFSRAFYAALAKGNPVDGAVQQGRWRITIDDPKTYDSRIFGTPVLYMHSRDGIILPPVDSSSIAV